MKFLQNNIVNWEIQAESADSGPILSMCIASRALASHGCNIFTSTFAFASAFACGRFLPHPPSSWFGTGPIGLFS